MPSRPDAIDTSVPNVARVYDYWLDGKDNFAADRDLAERMLALDPGLRQRVRDNRAFLTAATARAARDGQISQFLDLGAGLPTRPAVHEAARSVIPSARIAYVDNDPVVATHAKALLATGDGLQAIAADLADPDAVLADPSVREVIRPGEPVGIIMGGVAHFYPPEQLTAIIASYLPRIAPGSWLIISTAHYDDEHLLSELRRMYTAAHFYNHGPDALRAFLHGTDIVPPGVVEARRWAGNMTEPPPRLPAYMLCAAGVKPPSR